MADAKWKQYPASLTSRDRIRQEISEQTDRFLQAGGRIEVVNVSEVTSRSIVRGVWWDVRGSGLINPG